MIYKKYGLTGDDLRMVAMILFWGMVLMLGVVAGSAAANAQMENRPWGFNPQNRASIAAMIRQVEEGSLASGAAGVQGVTSNITNLVCGGGEESAATANSTCVILNNAAADLELGQDSDGDQQATSTGMSDILDNIDG